jgi:hypothetical protein
MTTGRWRRLGSRARSTETKKGWRSRCRMERRRPALFVCDAMPIALTKPL